MIYTGIPIVPIQIVKKNNNFRGLYRTCEWESYFISDSKLKLSNYLMLVTNFYLPDCRINGTCSKEAEPKEHWAEKEEWRKKNQTTHKKRKNTKKHRSFTINSNSKILTDEFRISRVNNQQQEIQTNHLTGSKFREQICTNQNLTTTQTSHFSRKFSQKFALIHKSLTRFSLTFTQIYQLG